MDIRPTAIPDVLVIEPKVFSDGRGFFMETYQAHAFATVGIAEPFVQDNHSRSRQGTLRGLHYQIQHAQGKLVRVVAGAVYDVAVDLRRGSSTFGRWVGVQVSEENRLQVWVPPGFAHGFYVLSEQADVVYKTTDFYSPEWERTLVWNDPEVGIAWPLVGGAPPVLSEKDARGKRLPEADLYA
jgi:dTDP-4-dehydrorhamnose 3,5-epimerase